MKRLIEKVDNKVLNISKELNRPALDQFIKELDESPQEFNITEGQLKTLKQFYDEGYINFDESFLKLPSLYYVSDRSDNIKNFAYTTRVISIISDDKQLKELYKSNKQNESEIKQLRTEIQKELKPENNGNYIYSTSKIREIVNDFDGRYKRLSKQQSDTSENEKEDWSNLRSDIEKLAARIYELMKNDRQRHRFEEANINDIETLYAAAKEAMSSSGENKAPREIQFGDSQFKDRINNKLDKAEDLANSSGNKLNIEYLSAKEIIDMLGEQQSQPQQNNKQNKEPVTIYKKKSGGYQTKDGTPVTVSEIEVEHYVGHPI